MSPQPERTAMYPTICYNKATKRVAFLEAPEQFARVLLELGTCNLGALTALLEPESETESSKVGGLEKTPLAKLTSGLKGGQSAIPAPMSEAKWMDALLSAINPGPDLKQLLLSVVGHPGEGRTPPSSDVQGEDSISKTVKWCCGPCLAAVTLLLANAPCPFGKLYGPRPCVTKSVHFLPKYQGQQDLDLTECIYTCRQGCAVFSNMKDVPCPFCSKDRLLRLVQAVLDEEGSRLALPFDKSDAAVLAPSDEAPRTVADPRKMVEVVPWVKRTSDEKMCILTDELEPLKVSSLTEELQAMDNLGLFSAGAPSVVSVNLGCKEICALARLARMPGQSQVLSTVFADVLGNIE